MDVNGGPQGGVWALWGEEFGSVTELGHPGSQSDKD